MAEKKICCIYKIVNTKNKKYYLGSCLDAKARKYRHFKDLRNQKHHCSHLQRAFNKYGESSFVFKIIKKCPPSKRKALEQKLLNKLDFTKAYNVSGSASGGDLIKNHPDREKIVKTKTEFLLAYNKRPEASARRRAQIGDKNPNYGKRWSKATRKRVGKIVKARLAKETKAERKSRIDKMKVKIKVFWASEAGEKKKKEKSDRMSGKKNHFYGKKHSKRVLKIIAQKNKGKENPNCHKPLVIEGVRYKSLVYAAKVLKVPAPTVCFRCNSTNPKFKEWNYEGVSKEVVPRKSPNAKRYRYKEQYFNSVTEAQKALGLTSIQARFRAHSKSPKWDDYEIIED